MTRLKIVLCLFCILLFAASAAHAGSGSAAIPHFFSSSGGGGYNTLYLHFSNTKSSSIDVTLTLYNKTGSIITDDGSATAGAIQADNVSNYSDNNSGSTVTLTIPAHSSSMISYQWNSSKQYGFGLVEWRNDTKDETSMLAQGYTFNANTNTNERMAYVVTINGGLPF